MSKDRQEPEISLNLDDEDIVERSATAGRRNNPPPPPPPPRNSDGGKRNGGFGVLIAIVLIIGLAGFSVYLYQELSKTQRQLVQSQGRLDSLEQRLSVTDESVTESSVSMQVKIKELDTEVRKLWDNVWKKQKEELGEHDVALDKLQKSLAALESKLKNNQAELNTALKSLSADKEKVTHMSGRLDKVVAQAEVNRKQLIDYGKQLTAGGSLDARVKELERRIQQNEDWLESINAFRRQVNRDIESLRTTVSQYHSASPPIQ